MEEIIKEILEKHTENVSVNHWIPAIHEDKHEALINDLLDVFDGDWLEFEKNKELFNESAKNNCLCKFDDGTVCRFNDDQPMAVLTHFKQ